MATQVFQTGATFELRDQFSEPLRKLLGGLTEADAAFKRLSETAVGFSAAWGKAAKDAAGSLSTLNLDIGEKAKAWTGSFDGVFASLGKGADAAVTNATAAFGRMDGAINATMGRLGVLASEFERLNAGAGTALASAGMSGARLSDRTSHGHGRNARAVFRGGTSGFEAASALLPFEVNPMTAGLAIGAAGVYEAIQQQHSAAKALMGGNLDAMAYGLSVPDLVGRIKTGASETGDSFENVADAYAAGSRILQGVDPTTRLKLVQDLLKPAEYEAQMKGVNIAESMKAMLELAHQTGTYNTEDVRRMASQFSVASLNSNDGLDALTRQSAYFLPQLHAALGLDFGSGVSLEVAAQNAGLTRAGTSVKNFFENSFAKTGKGADAHNDALRALGLIGDDDKPLWQRAGKDGKTDWTASEVALGEMIERKIAGMDDTARSDTLHHAFGEQGGRLAALLSTQAFREQVTGIKGRVDQFGGDGDLLGKLKSVDPMQQWRETWTDLKNVLGDIGSIVLPPLNLALHGFDDLLKGIHSTFATFGGILSHGDPANRPPTMEERSRMLNPGIHKSAFEEITAGGRDGPLADAIAGGFLKAFRELQGGGAGGINVPNVTGSGGFTNASFTTFGGSDASDSFISRYARGGSGGGLGHFFSAAVREANIRNTALGLGMSPDVAMAVARSEGFGTFTGDHGTSFGDLQMHIGGGLGDRFRHATGKDPSDPRNELELDRYALGVAKREGWGSWHGAARIGVHGFRGIGAAPAAGAPPRQPMTIHIHNEHNLDGKTIARSTTKHQTYAAMFPTAVGSIDTYGSFASPGTPLNDAA